jgi:dGTPase
MADVCETADTLAPWAMCTQLSRGRRHPEPEHAFRTLYQRDRDRIIHSSAFRRLMHKTQVLTQTNDHHRTRLTHTLEVAQIARTIARRLRLNEDLTESIALSHDLGHPPFGHAGEKALDECMANHGGFEHNLHALRLVEVLEHPYPDFPGLNLTYEVLESMALHSPRGDRPELEDLTSVGRPVLEGQVAEAADSLAYDTHDIDDGLNAGLIQVADLLDVPLCRMALEAVQKRYGAVLPEQMRPTLIRALIDLLVTDLLEHTQERLVRERIESVADVRIFSGALVSSTEMMLERRSSLEDFLRTRVYDHVRVVRMAHKGERIVRELFSEFCGATLLLPEPFRHRAKEEPQRAVCDYLAGMTDRYAQDEYLRLFHPFVPL